MLHTAKLNFLTFYIKADTAYSVHSPFVYNLAAKLVDKKHSTTREFSEAVIATFRPKTIVHFKKDGEILSNSFEENNEVIVFILDSSFFYLQTEFRQLYEQMQLAQRIVICRNIRASGAYFKNWQAFSQSKKQGIVADAWSWACYAELPGQKKLLKYALVPSHWKPLSFRQFFPHIKQV